MSSLHFALNYVELDITLMFPCQCSRAVTVSLGIAISEKADEALRTIFSQELHS